MNDNGFIHYTLRGLLMYSIKGMQTVFDVMAYTVSAMKQSGVMPGEIEDYIADAVKGCNLHIIQASKDRIEDCNELLRAKEPDAADWFEDTWREHYYSSLWDDDGERYKCDEDDEDVCSYLTGRHRKYYWDDDNVIDDIKSDEEAYEGFDSCKNYYWNSNDDNEYDDSNWELKGHHIEFEPELSYDPWENK